MVPTHWSIENELHGVLDIAFRADASRVRMGKATQNFARLRHLALNRLKRETSVNVGLKAKRLKAASNTDYLLKGLLA
jgi:predicted transposase YbfD/YdcC